MRDFKELHWMRSRDKCVQLSIHTASLWSIRFITSRGIMWKQHTQSDKKKSLWSVTEVIWTAYGNDTWLAPSLPLHAQPSPGHGYKLVSARSIDPLDPPQLLALMSIYVSCSLIMFTFSPQWRGFITDISAWKVCACVQVHRKNGQYTSTKRVISL